jgi:hypothetical protein
MPHSEHFIDGVFYPSVTTILAAKPRPWLDAWREKWGILAERKMKIANAVGTEVHRCIDSLLNTGIYTVIPPMIDGVIMPSLIPRISGMVLSFEGWLAGITGEVFETELRVVSRQYVYSGTLDMVGKIGKVSAVVDWKTSSKIYDDMQLQLAAYAHAYNEQTNSKIKDGLIVCVSKDKPDFKLTVKWFKLGKRPFKQFLKLREMFAEIKAKEAFDAETANTEATGC